MAKILHINSSVRSHGSISRQLSEEFLGKWRAAHPADTVVERDLAANPVPHLSEQAMAAFFTAAEARSAEQALAVRASDRLIDELLAADVIVIGAPMYNFSVSSALKAWIDHLVRAGRTFRHTEAGPVGLVGGKRVFVFSARGGVYSTGPAKVMDFHETYLRGILGFMGLSDITFVHSEGLGMGEEAVAKALEGSRQSIDQLICV